MTTAKKETGMTSARDLIEKLVQEGLQKRKPTMRDAYVWDDEPTMVWAARDFIAGYFPEVGIVSLQVGASAIDIAVRNERDADRKLEKAYKIAGRWDLSDMDQEEEAYREIVKRVPGATGY